MAEPDPETFRTMLAQVERLGRLVKQLLDLSRLESGAVPLERTEFRVEPLLAHAVREQRLHAPEIDVSIVVDSPDLTADGDPERVHQVVANLLENAVRHTPRGGVVEVCAHRTHDGVVIEVVDEGPGIPESEQTRIFERFYRADTARASSDGGAGLGLAIAQWIVDLHGGDIHPERREPHGCRMVVTLPRQLDHEEPPMPLATIDDALKRIRRGEMVLVVDDEDRENEGDLTMAASWVTPEAVNFMLRWGRGLVCMPCDARARRARHVADGAVGPCGVRHRVHGVDRPRHRGERHRRGRSRHDHPQGPRPGRAPVATSSDPATCSRCAPAPGGVLERRGHTEAAVDLARLAGLPPVAAICEVLHEDGSPARLSVPRAASRPSTGSPWCRSTRSPSTGSRSTTPTPTGCALLCCCSRSSEPCELREHRDLIHRRLRPRSLAA